MKCPNCGKELIAVERHGIELDWCQFCNGFWFDDGEWNLLLNRLLSCDFVCEKVDLYSIPEIVTKEKTKLCTVCGGEMQKFELFGVILDRCIEHHGIWFDKSEFSKCANAASKDSSIQVKFLNEVFLGK
ncbi:zf-TFIIB domain-containing protein [bacterium]|nr:zf-TFIIB domain-containing protein [bacterium]